MCSDSKLYAMEENYTSFKMSAITLYIRNVSQIKNAW